MSPYRPVLFTLLLTILVLSAAPALAFRCGNDLIQKGDHLIEVLKACGEPAYREEWVEEKAVLERPHRLLPYRHTFKTVPVKEWTYNFGPRKFMRMIRFENGVVRDIESLDYGF